MGRNESVRVESLAPGDVIEFRQTYVVEGPFTTSEHRAPGVHLLDAQNPSTGRLLFPDSLHGSQRTILVKKASPRRPKFHTGDIITGKQLRETMWKRGTVVRTLPDEFRSGAVSVLQTDGTWRGIRNGDGSSFDWNFSPANDNYRFAVLHVA